MWVPKGKEYVLSHGEGVKMSSNGSTIMDIFQDLDDETRHVGLKMITDMTFNHRSELRQLCIQAANDGHAAEIFLCNDELARLLFLWLECGENMILTKLSWIENN
jgi:hypothetical protein